ncbi:MAG TPA: primosomal protein N' [Ignavibacteriales bacterium]|nr:primosomal protein N' [Ignavibacteriales bacterium]HOL81483.1 primosomal protein N' [Ignavibacteriales bacterium]HOM65381.1 primosomal protein N' [Ignavibacteriales bacterium]HPD67010.1 primosomal protein N' [Ignavibacteriales bacterium]HRR18830.1 primosomal protein N' [Ignavibacteriales bacterium]
MFAEVAFPIPLYQNFYYNIPEEIENIVKIGSRVIAPFRNKYITGFVVNIINSVETDFEIKPIYDVIDIQPVLSEKQLQFYKFISEYYLTPLGEVLKLATLPGINIKLEDIIVPDHNIMSSLPAKENSIKYKIISILSTIDKISLSELKKIVNKNNINGIIQELQNQKALEISTQIHEKNVKEKTIKFVKILKQKDEIYDILSKLDKRSLSQIELGIFIINNNIKEIEYQNLIEIANTTANAIKSLQRKNILEIIEKPISRKYDNIYTEEHKILELLPQQKIVFDEIKKSINDNKFQTFLLYGVTGSGKTQVYIELVNEVIKRNKNAIILVPEISLTPQITARFQNNFGNIVTFIHSKMSDSYKHDIWKGILKNKYKIVIGPRSALFTPLENIGIIIVDEEHDSGYKQTEQMPTYNARDLAIYKAKLYNAPVILGSATPSFESYYNCKIGKYKFLSITERVKNTQLPEIIITDLKSKNSNYEYFSKIIIDKIENRLSNNEGVIILQNRKGFAPRVICKDCGNTHECPYCSVTMVYHLTTNLLKCHYCGYNFEFQHQCHKCHSNNFTMLGTGTEKIEDELETIFPDAKIVRVDSESISNKDKLPNILNDFKNRKIDILVGTQLLSKGLDFPHLTLVGVINADLLLAIPEYKTEERTMQILSQVAGRAGRDLTKGEVIVQTYKPQQDIFSYLIAHKYLEFVEKKLDERKKFKYPPYYKFIKFEIKSKNLQSAKSASLLLYNLLSKYKLDIKKPTEAPIFKLNNYYRYQIILRNNPINDNNSYFLKKSVFETILEFNKQNKNEDIRLLIDVDPV